jgi:hypothetical protein
MAKYKKQAITFAQDFESFRIYIDGLIHVYVVKKYFTGFTSYKQSGCYFIELWFENKRELIAHETKDNWIAILKLIDENL